jgi:uncharacterized protein
MQLNLEGNPAKYQINGYTANSVTVNGQIYTQSVLVMPQYFSLWDLNTIEKLSQQNLLDLAALKPEIILLGTGSAPVFPDPAIAQVLFAQHIGMEVMTTAAACRTYAALTAEGRNVLAALIV